MAGQLVWLIYLARFDHGIGTAVQTHLADGPVERSFFDRDFIFAIRALNLEVRAIKLQFAPHEEHHDADDDHSGN